MAAEGGWLRHAPPMPPDETTTSSPDAVSVELVLRGDNGSSHGVEVELDLVRPREKVLSAEPGKAVLREAAGDKLPEGQEWGLASASGFPVIPAHSFRVVPLLAVMNLNATDLTATDRKPRLLVAVGDFRIQARPDAPPLVTVVLGELWAAPLDGVRVGNDTATWATGADDVDLKALLVAAFNRTGAIVATRSDPRSRGSRPATQDELVTALAKGLAEQSRNAVKELREVRYRMERQLGQTLREKPDASLNDLLADVVELALAAGRARDEARDTVREGLWVWRTEREEPVYQALRRQLDPTLRFDASAEVARDVSWFQDLESAAVQARNMEALLGEEVLLLHSLLDAASTVSVARDAKAQEDFNYVAAVGGVGLGLLALVLALYSASDIVPLGRANYVRLLVPLAVAAAPAIFLAVWLRRERKRSVRYFLSGVVAVAFALGLLAFAGSRVPAPPGTAPEPVFVVPRPTPTPSSTPP